MKKKYVLMVLVLVFINLSLYSEEKTEEKKKKNFGLVPIPIIASAPETGLVLGAALSIYNNPNPDDPKQKMDNGMIMAQYSLKNQIMLDFSGEKYFTGNDYKVTQSLKFEEFPTSFFGIGNEISDKNEEKYKSTAFSSETIFMFQIIENLYVGPSFQFYKDKIDEKENLLASGFINGSEGMSLVGSGITVNYDTRDSYSYPHKGVFHEFTWQTYRKEMGSDYNFGKININLRKFFRLHKDHVFGINGVYQMVSGDVPFQMIPRLGGQNMMRGFVDNKYRDKHYAAFQGEYRFPIYSRIGGAVFGSVGEIASGVTKFNLENLKSAVGTGLRVNLDKSQHMNLRIDFAYSSDEKINFYIGILEAF